MSVRSGMIPSDTIDLIMYVDSADLMFELQAVIHISERAKKIAYLRTLIQERLNDSKDIYTVRNLEVIEDHLRNRLDAWSPELEPYNPAMVERQHKTLLGELKPTPYDLNWMKHELIESGLMAHAISYVEAHRLANEAIGHGPEERENHDKTR